MAFEKSPVSAEGVENLVFGAPGTLRAERAVAELRAGRPVVLHSEKGDVAVLALDTATPAIYEAFMAASADRGMLYLTPPRAKVLGLDAPSGALVPAAGLDYHSLCQLGYMRSSAAPMKWSAGTPLAAQSALLARVALLLPAILVADIQPDEPLFSACIVVMADDVEESYRGAAQQFQEVARTPVPLKNAGTCEFVIFRGGFAQRDQLAIIVGKPDFNQPVPVRVHSSCITGDLFGSLKCDCGDQLNSGLQILGELGGGILLYLDQEGRGTGLASKMRAYGLQHQGLDTVDADAHLGFGGDERRYEAAVAMLRGLGVHSVELLTNNPAKIAYLSASGIEVLARVPVEGSVTTENENYLRTKVARSGHIMDVDTMIERNS
ncbi:GTP cyclohydrolase II RibA [Aureimonas fodinaquatilis]|uniref:GTP cyclohydrolase-2 n=1 Tax=Aureimonas fodinaquatilis TaxID=2565783 RepID=A0A5B0DUN9_9HYPH|nr:GTP cyclohydrolase II RibA [Aureimonas fodinaquatilis]KAA0970527.1 GTP cyclohydrolase II RibA [Aureimonas fodinaquatilis]